MSIVPIFSYDCNFSNSQEGIEGKSKHCLEEVLAVMICACVCTSVSMRRSSIGFTMGIQVSKIFCCLWQAHNSLRMRKELVGLGIAFNLWTYHTADTKDDMVEGLYDWLTKYAMNRARFDTRTGNCSLMEYFCANWTYKFHPRR